MTVMQQRTAQSYWTLDMSIAYILVAETILMSYWEAVSSLDAAKWQEAVREQMQAM